MIRSGTYASLLLLCASASFADPLRVLSGDHRQFTRIVVPLPANVAWDAERTGRKVTVNYQGHAQGFDNSTVFEKITRERVLSVSSTESSLAINLDCNCDISAFETGNGFIAIDIADRGTAVREQLPEAQPEIATTTSTPRLESVALPWMGSNALQVEAALNGPVQVASEAHRTSKRDFQPGILPTEEAANSSILESAQKQLSSEVGIAASRGLLIPDRAKVHDTSPELEAVAKKPYTVIATRPIAPSPGNIRFSTSLDVLDADSQGQSLSTSSGNICPADKEFAVETWADEDRFEQAISKRRSNLFGEFDVLDHAAARRLAQAYIYFGFGVEAIAILKLDADLFAANPSLIAIAEILEKGHIAGQNNLEQFVDCESDVALWAILSKQRHTSNTLYDAPGALRAVNKLPVHLRHFIAPMLSDRFLMNHDETNAAAALRSIERLAEPVRSDGKMAQANLSIKMGDTEKGEERLEAVLAGNSQRTPEALVKLVRTRLDQNEPISPETSTLVDAYVDQYRGSEMGDQLREAQVLALAKSGQFDSAFATFRDSAGRGNAPLPLELNDLLLIELTAAGSDIVFLEHVLSQPIELLAALPAKHRYSLVRRLLSLGFGSFANNIIIAAQPETLRDKDRLLSAEIALELSEPLLALTALATLSSAEANVLRAEASEMVGRFDEAHALYRLEGKENNALEAAWLSDSWNELIDEADTRFGGLSALASQERQQGSSTDGMLGQSLSALEESTQARKILGAFLETSALLPDDAPEEPQ